MALYREDLVKMAADIAESAVSTGDAGRYAINNPELVTTLIQNVYDKLESIYDHVEGVGGNSEF